jgi:predicted AAA+ superfamily ATPase
MTRDIFDLERISAPLDAFLRDTNPWWDNRQGKLLPSYRRWAFHATLRKLEGGLAPIVVLRGPRQVGKTTLQLQMIEHLPRANSVAPRRIFRVQF